MHFQKLPGNRGKIYIPEKLAGGCCKHNCPDCYSCQWCGNERCKVCYIAEVHKANTIGPEKKINTIHNLGRRRNRPSIDDPR